MTAEEYFGDWMKVIDKSELLKVMRWLQGISRDILCPSYQNIFKAFKICSYNECKVVILGQDPYPQPGIATGIAFGNIKNISPSLEVIKEAVIDYSIPHNHIDFDNTLESWAKQGILMLNSALTCRVNIAGSHVAIWRPFISKLIYNMSSKDNGLVFILFGKQAQSFKQFIKGYHKVLEENHPAYYARENKAMPSSVFIEMNKYLKDQYNTEIKLYNEYYE